MPLGSADGSGATKGRKRRGDIRDPYRVPTETGAGRLGEPLKTTVHDLSDKKEETESPL